MQKTASPGIATRTPEGILHTLSGITLLLLAAQFLIGMVVNLYVQIPSVHPGTRTSNYFQGVGQGVVWVLGQGSLSLVVHAALGLILALISIFLIGFAIAARKRVWIFLSVAGWIGIVGAGFNGVSFLNYGHDFSSLLMSVGFLLAMISYTISFSLGR